VDPRAGLDDVQKILDPTWTQNSDLYLYLPILILSVTAIPPSSVKYIISSMHEKPKTFYGLEEITLLKCVP
jgi:hypothetical protein